MKALCWHGKGHVQIDNVLDPKIEHARDAVIKVTACAICGSDLHIYDGYTPTMESGDVLGHEFMGEVMEVGSEVSNLKVGDRVVIPFNIACGQCWFCENKLFALCDRSNPNAAMATKVLGQSPSALFGYSHLYGGFPGGQAEYVRVPYADTGHIKVPDGVTDEQALYLSDIFPTGYMAAENANIQPGDTVAIWGCGPVGQFTIQSAWMLGAGRVIAIDMVPERLAMAATHGNAETINFDKEDVYERLMEMTGGRGPDSCIDAVGTEAHGTAHGAGNVEAVMDKVKNAVGLATDRAHTFREAVKCCRKGGTVSVPGVYFGYVDQIPMGIIGAKGLTIKSGQTHTHRYLQPLMDKVVSGEIDPSFVITHKIGLDEAPDMYKTFRDKQDGCIKTFIRP